MNPGFEEIMSIRGRGMPADGEVTIDGTRSRLFRALQDRRDDGKYPWPESASRSPTYMR